MFGPRQFLWRNLRFHWRGNLAVLLGVAVGTAVLTGALFVGDSLRGSLQALAEGRLGWVEQALVANRFFRNEIVDALHQEPDSAVMRSAPVLLLRGTALGAKPASNVTVFGVDEQFWPAVEIAHEDREHDHDHGDHKHAKGEHDDMEEKVPSESLWASDAAKGALNARLARDLGAKAGDKITLFVQTSAGIPRESLLGRRKIEDAVKKLSVTVHEVLPDNGMGGFSLKPTAEATRNIFLPVGYLQQQLDVGARVNGLLVANSDDRLQEEFEQQLTLFDWGLRRRTPGDRARAFAQFLDPRNDDDKIRRVRWKDRIPEELAKQADAEGVLTTEQIVDHYRRERPYISLESRQMYLEPAVVKAALQAAGNCHLKPYPTLIYLADTIADKKPRGSEVPYAVIAAMQHEELATLAPEGKTLGANEIILTEWPDSPLTAEAGDQVVVRYYSPDDQGRFILKEETFTVRAKIALKGRADDPDLTPEFPGITDKLNMASWENPPFPYQPSRISLGDEEFWKRYRTTPKAYVSLETGQRLWSSRFGDVTSIRLYSDNEAAVKELADLFANKLLTVLPAKQGGFVFQPVRQQGASSAAGNFDFGVLFLAFSFFLIVSALMLVGLLVRLNTERRAAEIGVLMASGWRRGQVRWLLIGEGLLLSVIGGVVGLVAAGVYAAALLHYLRNSWPGGLPALGLHVTPTSVVIGFAAGVVVSLLTILWALRILGGISPRGLLGGEATEQSVTAKKGWVGPWVIGVCVVGAAASLAAGFFVTGHEAKAGSFFGSGALLLIALLTLIFRWLRRSATASSSVAHSLGGLAIRNAARQPVRSLLTLSLLASATFLLVAVQVFHRHADESFYEKNAGSGGFHLLAEPTIAVFQDLNDPGTREQLLVQIENELGAQKPELRSQPDTMDKILEEKDAILQKTKFYGFRVRNGDDTSCLNLYRPQQPRILGVPHNLVARGGFAFSGTAESVDNPWTLLEKPVQDDAIPVFADANSATWILKKGLGDIIEITDGPGNTRKLQIVGLLQGSIFQSELLMADANFKKLFPREEGFRFFLIDSPEAAQGKVQETLRLALADHGFIADDTAARLEQYLNVENTYLATFQALGAFGLLLGALGLAVVLLRSIWERRAELALMRALGFRRNALAWLVLAENAWLLLLGLAVGTAAALLSVAPHLVETGSVDWPQLIMLLGGVLLVGLAAGTAAVMATLRAPLVPALRRE